MKNFAARLLLGFLLLAPASALAQSTGTVVADCTTGIGLAYTPGSTRPMTLLPTGQACITGNISASLSGFTAASTGTPITATTGGATGTLPAGTVVVATNTGTTNAAYCALGGAATTASQYIAPNGGWFAFTVGASTQLTCATSTSTTTVNMTGGAGLPTGTGGGGGSGGGGGGAVTMASGAVASGAYSSGSIASGAFASGSIASGAMAAGSHAAGSGVDGWDLTQGAIADAAVTAGATGSVSAKLRSISRDVMTTNTWAGGTLGAMATYGTSPGAVLVPGVNAYVTNTLAAVGNNSDNVAAGAGAASPVANYNYAFDGTTWDRVRAVAVDPCEATAQSYAPISITTATTTRIVAPSASNKTYICSLVLVTAAANNVGIVEGTGGTCGSGTAGVVGGTTAANGPNFSANGGLMLQAGGKVAAAQTAGTNVDLCLITSAATPLAGGIKYVQAP